MLDERDLEFIETLGRLNVPKNVAALIIYLANVKEATSREIELGTDLRQPEVSIGVRALRENQWVNERDIKAELKGRPMKIYELCMPLEKIIKHFEEEKNRESARTMESIQRLKEMAAI